MQDHGARRDGEGAEERHVVPASLRGHRASVPRRGRLALPSTMLSCAARGTDAKPSAPWHLWRQDRMQSRSGRRSGTISCSRSHRICLIHRLHIVATAMARIRHQGRRDKFAAGGFRSSALAARSTMWRDFFTNQSGARYSRPPSRGFGSSAGIRGRRATLFASSRAPARSGEPSSQAAERGDRGAGMREARVSSRHSGVCSSFLSTGFMFAGSACPRRSGDVLAVRFSRHPLLFVLAIALRARGRLRGAGHSPSSAC